MRRRCQEGRTLLELMVVIIMASVLMLAIFTAYMTGQQAFGTSELLLQAQQSARNAITVMTQDLLDAGLMGFYGTPATQAACPGCAVFVKFRRLEPTALITTTGAPDWQDGAGSSVWMYLWCPDGTASSAPCGQIVGPQPTNRQLLLVTSPSGVTGSPWNLNRVVAQNLQDPLDPLVTVNPDLDRGLTIDVRNPSGAVIEGEFATPISQAEWIDVTVATAQRGFAGLTGRVARSRITNRVQFRNPQE